MPRRSRGADVLHSLANTGPLRSPVPHVLTMHDVNFFPTPRARPWATHGHRPGAGGDRGPPRRPADRDLARRRATRSRACSARPRIASTSSRTAPAARRSTRCPRRRCAPHTGSRARASCCASPPSGRTRTRRRCCGRSRTCRRTSSLVLAGHPEAYDARLRQLAARARRGRAACGSPGYADDAELEALWRLAACAAFPTRAEGFGLPMLEAMRRGVPVACSDLPVLREVGGDVPRLLRS